MFVAWRDNENLSPIGATYPLALFDMSLLRS